MEILPGLVIETCEEEYWLEWIDARNRYHRYSKADFRRFVAASQPDGLGTTVTELLEDLKGNVDAQMAVNDALVGEQGAPHDNRNGAGMRLGSLDLDRCSTNRDNITVCTAPTESDRPATIPLPSVPEYSQGNPRPKRDYSREAPTGTSVSYALRRIHRERPDLLERVKAGELTPTGAMVEAGFKDRQITLPSDPAKAARRLLIHFQGERLESLIWALSEGLRAT